MEVKINVSAGELFDKITILQIKSKKVKDPAKLETVNKELNLLLQTAVEITIPNNLFELLQLTNEQLWLIEDRIRVKEARKEFDNEFIELARSVYYTNDKRCSIKAEIDAFLGSSIQEVKEYVKYK